LSYSLPKDSGRHHEDLATKIFWSRKSEREGGGKKLVGKGERKNPCGKQRRWEQQHKRLPELLFSLAPGVGTRKILKGCRRHCRYEDLTAKKYKSRISQWEGG